MLEKLFEPDLASLIEATEKGNESAASILFSALYDELHRIAKRKLARRGAPPVSSGATALLNTAYIDLRVRDTGLFPDRARFMGYASRVMHGLIIDYVRNRNARIRGGEFHIYLHRRLPTDFGD